MLKVQRKTRVKKAVKISLEMGADYLSLFLSALVRIKNFSKGSA